MHYSRSPAKPASAFLWRSQLSTRVARLRRAATRVARRPRRTCACSSSPRASLALCARAPPASTGSVLTAAATSWVASRASRVARQKGCAQMLCCQGAAKSLRSIRARQSLVRSTSSGAFGVCPALALCMCHRLNACAVGRYCDISEMSGEHRGNNLQGAVSNRVLRPRPLLLLRHR